MNGHGLTWRCEIRADLAARAAAVGAGIEQALTETLERLAVDRAVTVTVDPVAGVPAGQWAVHRLDGHRVAHDPEPARRALALLVAGDPGVPSDPWRRVQDLDDTALAEWAGVTVRGALAARPSLALGPEDAAGPSGSVRALALDQGWTLPDAEGFVASADAGDVDVPAQPRCWVDVSPGLLEWLTTREESRELLAHVAREVRERTGVLTPLLGDDTVVPAPELVVRPDPGLPERSFRLRTGVLPDVPYAAPGPDELLVPAGSVSPPARGSAVDPRTGALGWRCESSRVWWPVQGLDAADQLRLALQEHLLAMAYRFVDDGSVERLLELVAADRPRLVSRVRGDVGVRPLTVALRALLRERWGIPSLPAVLQQLVDRRSGSGELDVIGVARCVAAPLGTDSGRRAIGLPTPVIELGRADDTTQASVDLLADHQGLLDRLRVTVESEQARDDGGTVPVVVVDPPLGDDVRRAVADSHPRLTVVARAALPREEPFAPTAQVTV